MRKIQIIPGATEALSRFVTPSELIFGRNYAPIMYSADFNNGQWSDLRLEAYGEISLSPACKVFHYAQEIFEGLKAYKTPEDGPFLFRPIENWKRFNLSAQRMSMAEIPEDLFMGAVKDMTEKMAPHIPKRFGESLYIRPFMFATEPNLGIKSSDSFRFMVIGALVGTYFSSPNVEVYVERESVRATPGGTGRAKAGGNYAASLLASQFAKKLGFDQTLWLDAIEHRYIEELSGMNFCAIIDGELWTPKLSDTILQGITRDSLLKIAPGLGIKVVETKMDIHELLEWVKSGKCSEAFACGTAAVITPIKSFGEADGKRMLLKYPEGKISLILKQKLINIQYGKEVGPMG